MYLGYLLIHVAFLLGHVSTWNVAVVVAADLRFACVLDWRSEPFHLIRRTSAASRPFRGCFSGVYWPAIRC